MNSNDSNDPQPLLSFAQDDCEEHNIQPDASGLASIEKSALDENHALMEEIVDDTIIEMAWARVKANRGAPGPDGITVKDFPEWFQPQWENFRQQLLDRLLQPRKDFFGTAIATSTTSSTTRRKFDTAAGDSNTQRILHVAIKRI